MIEITVFRDREGRITGFRAVGHSGWAQRGSDIVCAGVAALTQTAVMGLVHHLGVHVHTEAGDGLLACRLPEGDGDDEGPVGDRAVQAVLGTMVLGLREIVRQYPRHVSLAERREGRREEKGGAER